MFWFLSVNFNSVSFEHIVLLYRVIYNPSSKWLCLWKSINMPNAAAHDVQGGSDMSCGLDCMVVAAMLVSNRIHLGCLSLLSLVRQAERVCFRTSAAQGSSLFG